MIKIRDITKKYKNKIVLDRLNFSIARGQKVMIFGSNGCGKTTLLKIIVGQIQDYNGEIIYDSSIKISSIIETPKFFENWSGEDNLNYFLETQELQNAENYIDLFEMREDIKRKVSCYSLGMKQKLLLILALSRDFDFLILDEPYISLDDSSIQKLDCAIANITDAQKSVLVVSHTINTIAGTFLFYHLKNGQLQPILSELSGLVKYGFEFTDSFYKEQALSCLRGLTVIGQAEKEIICLIKKDEISHYIEYLSKYSITQARLLQLTEQELCYMEGIHNA